MSYAEKLVGLEGFSVDRCVHHLHRTFLEYIQDPEYATYNEYVAYDEHGPICVDSQDNWERHEVHVYKGNTLMFSLHKSKECL